MEEDHQMLNSGVIEHPWKITVHDTIIKKVYPMDCKGILIEEKL